MIKLKSFEVWFYGLLAAIIGGAATALAAKLVLPNTIVDFNDMWKLAMTSGLINAVFYLKQAPVPKQSTGDTELTPNPDSATTKP